ncbi:hypothetical protein XA3_12320 [Xylocopilactobacillus apicola]|uniref:DUF218 domain-containing protein n=1 Tax=Xylocopilactobacillus apicola TaxID=2932184 RepID=A0AAU9D213_9LACO|nr:hypothetical protein XA3_12320 [Xylocopilactobacillus apicola]
MSFSILACPFIALQMFFFNDVFFWAEILVFEGITTIFSFIFSSYLLYQLVKLWIHKTYTISDFLSIVAVICYLALLINFSIINRGFNQRLLLFVLLSTVYLTVTFANFFLSSLVYGLYIRFQNVQNRWFVCLGAGLLDGRFVGKLLANRIKTAVSQAEKSKDLTPVIIFSGGQGANELVSEASAMQKYAVEDLKFPLSCTLMEDRSRSTKENLLFSAKLVEGDSFIFCTSDYHVFRAALLAKKLGFNANGIGCKTSFCYRTIAFLREYVGVLALNKKRHLIILGLFLLISIILGI